MDNHDQPWRGSPLWLWANLAAGLGLLLSFIAVGHLAGRPFRVLSLLLIIGSAGIVLYKPALRYLLLGLAIITAPRLVSLTAQVESHHVLLPIFLGMSAGLLIGRGHRTECARGLTAPEVKIGALFGLFIVFNWSRALVDYYSPFILFGTPLQDLIVAPGVSANYAFYLSQLLLIHMAGPVLFIFCDQKFRVNTEQDPAGEILTGLALGTGANLVVALMQWIGVDAFWTGTGRSREAARLPGLFSDSGAATILFPVLLAGLLIFLLARARSRTRRIFIGAALLLIFAILGLFEGRGYWVAAAGTLFLLVPFARSAYSSLANINRSALLTAVTFALLGLGGALWFATPAGRPGDQGGRVLPAALKRVAAGEFLAAYRSLNRPRALQAEGGWLIVRERPFAGAGANSFMVEIRRFESRLAGIEIDNPAHLLAGLTGDFGLFGTALLLLLAWLAWRGRAVGRSAAGLYLQALPICLAPTFLFGYHLVFAEFCALLCLPLLLPRAPEKENSPGATLGLSLAGLFLIAFVLAWWFDADFRVPPAYWRAERGAPPQLHPDRVAMQDGKTFFYFNARRDFALDQPGPVVWGDADADLAFYCYGTAGPEPVHVERTGTRAAGAPNRTVLLRLTPACVARPNLEIRHRNGGQFALDATRFRNGFLLRDPL